MPRLDATHILSRAERDTSNAVAALARRQVDLAEDLTASAREWINGDLAGHALTPAQRKRRDQLEHRIAAVVRAIQLARASSGAR